MSFVPKDDPSDAGGLIEGAKDAALQQAGAALIGKVAGKKAEKLQKAVQVAQQVLGASGKLRGAGGAASKAAGGVISPMYIQAPGTSPAEPPGAAEVAASLQPVWVGCEVNIDGLVISPVLSLQITQTHGDHNTVEIHFPHRIIQENTFTMENSQSLLGKVAEVAIKNRNNPGGGRLENHFVIASVSLDQSSLDDGILVVTGYSPTILLDGAPHYESFHKKTLKDIATIIGKPLAQAKGSIKPAPTISNTLIYTSRYNENSWNFLKRLSAETGQWLYYNGTALIFGKPEKGRALELIYGSNCYQLTQQIRVSALQTGLFDYDATAHNPLSGAAGSYTGNAGSYAENAFSKSKELYAAPTYATPSSHHSDKSVVEAVGKARSAGRAAGMYVMKGESTIYELRVGALVDVSFRRLGESAAHSQMRIIFVSHSLDAAGNYTNSFEAMPATAEMPPPPFFTKPVTYPMLAVVLSNADPSGQGRVQVQFMGWKQDHSPQQTDWIRVLTPDAGGTESVMQNRGQLFIPEVGDQVMIDFEGGNPDRPYVTGSLYHGNNASGQGGKDNTLKSITTRSGHRVDFDDSNGGTSITITDISGNTIYFDTQGSNITITAPETMTLNAKNVFVNADEHISVSAGMNISQSSGMSTVHSAGDNMSQYVVNDYKLVATNIMKIASENMDVQARSIEKTSEEMKVESSKKGITMNSAKTVDLKSAEKSKLF